MLNKTFIQMKMSQETSLENSVLGKTAKPIGNKADLNRVQEQQPIIFLQKNQVLQF